MKISEILRTTKELPVRDSVNFFERNPDFPEKSSQETRSCAIGAVLKFHFPEVKLERNSRFQDHVLWPEIKGKKLYSITRFLSKELGVESDLLWEISDEFTISGRSFEKAADKAEKLGL